MDRKLTAALVAEAAGTCLFFIVGARSIVLVNYAPPGPGLLGIALAHGLVLAVLVSSLGAVSGEGSYRFIASDDEQQFLTLGQRFFGDTIEHVEIRTFG